MVSIDYVGILNRAPKGIVVKRAVPCKTENPRNNVQKKKTHGTHMSKGMRGNVETESD